MNESYIFAVRSFQNPEASVSFIFIFYKKKSKLFLRKMVLQYLEKQAFIQMCKKISILRL